MSLVDAERLNTSPLVYMIGDILPENGSGFFWGPSGSGKTFTILDAALAVCNGVPWLGHATLPGTVAYAAGEGGGGLGIRIKARVLRQEADNTAAVAAVARDQGDEAARSLAAGLPPYTSRNLKVTTEPFPMHFLRAGKPNPDLEQAMAELSLLNAPGPDCDPETWPYLRLVILDALENFAGQLSVSHRSSANRIIATMQWMAAQLQCCVLAVAHPVHSPGGGLKMVGSDRLFAASDFVIRYAPDEVAAPGALRTATISCEKSKDDTEFSSFGVELHPCKWDEPKLDSDWNPVPVLGEDGKQAVNEDGSPAWVTEEVTSQTIRLIEQEARTATAATPARQVMPLPELRDNRPRSRVRPMLRPAPAAPAFATVPPKSAAAGPDLTAQLLGPRCDECGRPGGMGCDVTMPGGGLVPVSLDPVLAVHASRVMDAATRPGSVLDLDKVQAWLASLPKAVPEPVPADEQDKRLWWTSVRPDKTGARA